MCQYALIEVNCYLMIEYNRVEKSKSSTPKSSIWFRMPLFLVCSAFACRFYSCSRQKESWFEWLRWVGLWHSWHHACSCTQKIICTCLRLFHLHIAGGSNLQQHFFDSWYHTHTLSNLRAVHGEGGSLNICYKNWPIDHVNAIMFTFLYKV